MIQVNLLRLGRVRYRQLKRVEEHRHEFFHVCYVLRGKGFVILNGRLYEVTTGQIHIYHPSWTHDIWAQPHAYFETLDLRFEIVDPKSYDLTKALPPFVEGPRADKISGLLRKIESLGTRRDNPLWKDVAHAHLIVLLSILMQPGEPSSPSTSTTSSPVPAAALTLMTQSLPKGISVGELAEQLFMSPTHLTTLFKAQFGKTAQEVMIQLKIEHAKQALVTNPMPGIANIAREYGWKDVRHFRRHFTDLTGMTPSAFAKHYSDYKASHGTDENWLVFDNTVPMRWSAVGPSEALTKFSLHGGGSGSSGPASRLPVSLADQ